MYVGTIHSFCLRILKEHWAEYRNFEVMDEVRQAALISANFTRFEDSQHGLGLDRLRSATRTGTYWETVRRFTTTLNVMHQKHMGAEDLPQGELRRVVERYIALAYGSPNYFFDYNRIIDTLIDKLESSIVTLQKVRDQFKHLVVDEYQDIDDRQEHLIQLLSNRGRSASVKVVGDDDQALFGFRGAKNQHILTFHKRYPKVHRVILAQNFRSTHAIVEVADAAVRRIPGRLIKEMSSARRDPATGVIAERLADRGDIQLSTFVSEEDEAKWVADRIDTLRGVVFEEKDGSRRALDYADMAILLRSVKSSGAVFARELRRRGTPVVISGTRGLFDNEEIRVVQAAFCLLARSDFGVPDDLGQLQTLNTLDTRQFVRDAVERMSAKQMPSASAGRFLEWIGAKLEELDRRSLKKEIRGHLARRIYPQAIFHEMLHELGSSEADWSPDVLFNLGAFSSLLAEFERVHQWVTPSRLKALCLFLGTWAASNAEEGGLDEVVRLNSVQIMTIHAAKGLEWPVVFLPRISSATFPSSRRSQGPETFLAADQFDPADFASGDDGERRLWYVAVTRCAKFLNVSSLARKRKRPTTYFTEIHHDVVRRDGTDPTDRVRGQPTPPGDATMLPTTYSDLSSWWRCRFEYQLRSLMGFSPGVGEQYGYGQQLHNILAELHERAQAGRTVTPLDVHDLVQQRFHLRYTQGPPFDALRSAAERSLDRYVATNIESLSQTQAVEKHFEFIDRESGALIAGVVDLLERVGPAESNDGHVREPVGIVDFKAHRIRRIAEFEKLREDAERQLQLYASAIQYAFPYQPVRAIAQLITPHPPSADLVARGVVERITVDVSDASRQAALRRVREAVTDIKASLAANSFSRTGPKTGWCRECDFRTFCPGFVEWRRRNLSVPVPAPPDRASEDELDQIIEDESAGP